MLAQTLAQTLAHTQPLALPAQGAPAAARFANFASVKTWLPAA